ncbi:MAG: hypothetical protein ACK56K_05435 [Akkermansiaceae bacterium]
MNNKLKLVSMSLLSCALVSCATLTEDSNDQIAMSFSDGSNGSVQLNNKRGSWNSQLPSTVSVRKSDDVLHYNAKTSDGRTASGSIPSQMGGKIVASAVFLDFGIVDAITDKHRKYPDSYVIPVRK